MHTHASVTQAASLEKLTSRIRQRGSAIIEFAVASLVFLAFLFGIIDFARILYTYEFVSYAARSGARWASVRGSSCEATNGTAACSPTSSVTTGATQTDIQTYVQSLNLPGIAPSGITATPTWPQTGTGCPANPSASNSPGCPVKVTVTYNYVSAIPFARITTLTLTADSQMVISQ